LLHQFLRLGCLALFHQLVQLFQHLVQLILGHLHALLPVLRGLGVGILAVLFGLLAHVVVQRVLHFLHQRVDFGGRGAVLDRFVHAVLGAFQPFEGVGQIAILDDKRDLPQFFGHGVTRGHIEVGTVAVEVADQDAQAQIGLFVADEAFGFVGDGFQDLADASGVGAVPQQVAPHLDQGGGEGVKEAAARQDGFQWQSTGGLACGVGGGKGHRDRQVRQQILGQVIDQRLIDLVAVAFHRHRQVERDRLDRLGVGGQAITAVDGGKVERDGDVALDDAVIVGRGEGLLEAAVRLAVHRAFGGDCRGQVGQDDDLPFAAAPALDRQTARLGDGEILRGLRGGGGIGAA